MSPKDPNRYIVTTDIVTTHAIIAMGYQGTAMKVIAALIVAAGSSPLALIPVLGLWAVDGHLLNSERRLRGRKPQTGWLGASFSQTLIIYYAALSVYAVLSAF